MINKFCANKRIFWDYKMKAITAVCTTGASVPVIANGRISRHTDGENEEIQRYLARLKKLVPTMPKNRKLSKLEVIQNVIDYICDLQSELETNPSINQFDPQAALNGIQQQMQSSPISPRQPLGVRPSPNTILSHQQHSIHEYTSIIHTVIFLFLFLTVLKVFIYFVFKIKISASRYMRVSWF